MQDQEEVVIETTEEVDVVEENAVEEGGAEENVEPEAAEELIIAIGDDEPDAEEEESRRAPDWVRDLRKSHRDLTKKNRELEAKLAEKESPKPAAAEQVGKKPVLSDYDYDTDKYETELAGWYERKRKADESAEQARRAQEEADKGWQDRLAQYGKTKTELGVPDYDDVEDAVFEHLSVVQQGILIQGAENPAKLVYALGKNAKKRAELAQITDPVRFAIAVGRLESQIKVTTRKPPEPEKRITGASNRGTIDSTLDRLRAEAEKTGDYSKVMQYKRQKTR